MVKTKDLEKQLESTAVGLAEDQVGTEEGRGKGPGNDVREDLQYIRF